MELNMDNISFQQVQMGILYFFGIIALIFIILYAIQKILRKKLGKFYLRPSQLCKKEIENEKIVTKYIKIILSENLSDDVYRKIPHRFLKDDWFTYDRVCKIGSNLKYKKKYNYEESSVRVGELLILISREYKGVELYEFTSNSEYECKNWEKILTDIEQECGITASIDVLKMPFTYEQEVL